eukprot:7332838-Prymnesium_polylepis.1
MELQDNTPAIGVSVCVGDERQLVRADAASALTAVSIDAYAFSGDEPSFLSAPLSASTKS